MSTPQAAAITSCTACAAVGGAAAGGAFSGGASLETETTANESAVNGEPASKENVPPSQPQPTPEVEPKWYPLSSETNQTPYASKIGKEYGHLLVGTYGTTANPTQPWWTKAYKKYEEDKKAQAKRTFSNEFGDNKVTAAFDQQTGSVSTALNKVCDSIYQKTKTTDVSIFHKDTQSTDQEKLGEDLWRYCSPFGKSPINLEKQTSTYTNGKIGNSKKDVLLSAINSDNSEIWSLKEDQFFNLKSVGDNFFKDLMSANRDDNTPKTLLRDKCKDAYDKNPNQSPEQLTEEIVEKYCSLKPIPSQD